MDKYLLQNYILGIVSQCILVTISNIYIYNPIRKKTKTESKQNINKSNQITNNQLITNLISAAKLPQLSSVKFKSLNFNFSNFQCITKGRIRKLIKLSYANLNLRQ